ncbi:hypothetical protein [Mycobacterium sp.]|uniref:hypothetical protein n=1 Tax=Mycobacterium sp. TaxID=1785 RepID=UPI002C69CA27|nr:hypothetical protein [Mycobacterium sp.]HTY35425.1 hypothetical protein [Mycobacterium sp.]
MSAVVGPVRYASVEDVKTAIDTQYTARLDPLILGDIESHSQSVEGLLHRKFWPCIDTRWFDWPNLQYAWPFTLHLEQHEVISVTSVVSGGVTIPIGNIYLEPNGDGPPYDRLEINLGTSSSFGGSAATWQRNIAVTGVYGFGNDTSPAGSLVGAINASVTTLTVSDSSLVGVGPAILIDTEYATVESRAMTSTGATITGDMAVSQAGAGLNVTISDTSKVHAGETILIDAERMLIQDRLTSSINVVRAYDGTPLAAHTHGATIYAPRQLTVVRGCWGTTAAAHLDAAPIAQHKPPALIRDLTIAKVITHAQWMSAGGTDVLARSGVGGGPRGKGAMLHLRSTQEIEDDAYARFGRKARTRSI